MQRAMGHTVVVALLATTGCTSGKDVVDKNLDAATRKLERMRSATRAALASPSSLPPSLPEPLAFTGKRANAYIAHVEHLAVPIARPEHDYVLGGDFTTARNLIIPPLDPSPTGAVSYYVELFQVWLAAKYLVIIQTDSFSGGTMTGASSYVGGRFTGTLHIVDIEEGISLGTLPVSASASDSLVASAGREAKTLTGDVEMRARDAIVAALAPLTDPNRAIP